MRSIIFATLRSKFAASLPNKMVLAHTGAPWLRCAERGITTKNYHRVLAHTGSPWLRCAERGIATDVMLTEIKMKEKHVVPTNNDSGKLRFRKIPPAHYTLKLESLSSLLESGIEKFETGDFEVGGCKWKLVFYPNGKNNLGDNSGHISLFLALAKPDDISLAWEVNVAASFFVYDQIRDRYLVVEDDADEKEWRFHKSKTERGFNSLLSHKSLKDSSNGYLLNDCCTMGVELLVIKSNLKGESFSLVKKPRNGLFTWKINGYSGLAGKVHSEVFTVEGSKWKLSLYPRGDSQSKSGYLSLFLWPESSQNIPPTEKIFVNYTLRVRDQINSNHHEMKATNWFEDLGWGFPSFMSLDDLKTISEGYLVNDQVIIEAEFPFILTSKTFG